MLKRLNIRCNSYQAKKLFHPVNGVRVSTDFSVKRAARVDKFSVHQNTSVIKTLKRTILAYLFVIDK